MVESVPVERAVIDLLRGASRKDLLKWTKGCFAMVLLMDEMGGPVLAEMQAREWLRSLPSFGVYPPAYLRAVNEAVHTAIDDRLRRAAPEKMDHSQDAVHYLTGSRASFPVLQTAMRRRAAGLRRCF